MSPLHLRILAFQSLIQLALAVSLPPLTERLLRLHADQARAVRWVFGGLMPSALVVVALILLVNLRPADRETRRRRVLAVPIRLAAGLIGVELLALVALAIMLSRDQAPLTVAAGLMMGIAAVLLLPPVPLAAFAKVTLMPLALELSDETAPPGRRISVATQLGYTIVAVAGAALVPAAVFGAAQLDVSAAADARSRAQQTGIRLQRAAGDLDVGAATSLLTRTPLSGHERLVLRAPSGTLLPEDIAGELHDEPYVEIPLSGALRGGALRVYYTARPRARIPLLLFTMLLLGAAGFVAAVIGRGLADDLKRTTDRIRRVTRDEEPGPPELILSAEVRRITHAANRLLERVPRFQVESFLAIERAQEAQRLKSQFLANMSHDLRSPLNSILGFSELLLRGIEGAITERQRKELDIIQLKGNELLRLLNEILDTAKLESGKMEMHKQASPPAELLRAAVQEARRGRTNEVADNLSVVLQPGMPPIHVDPLRVTQAVTHLINSALDLGSPRVVLRAREAEGPASRLFILEMEHDATIKPEDAGKLFDGFRRLGGVSDLNLALPLAKRLAELHGGSLEAVSMTPVRFRMTIPI
jgi:signal transduction histidine kinase